jgi:hypothetical protein
MSESDAAYAKKLVVAMQKDCKRILENQVTLSFLEGFIDSLQDRFEGLYKSFGKVILHGKGLDMLERHLSPEDKIETKELAQQYFNDAHQAGMAAVQEYTLNVMPKRPHRS